MQIVRKFSVVLVGAFLLLTLFGCNSAQSPAATVSGSDRAYYPNLSGESWTYRETFIGTPGFENLNSTATVENTFIGEIVVSGETYQMLRLREFYNNLSNEVVRLIKVSDSGVCDYGTIESFAFPPSYTLKFPLFVGQKWSDRSCCTSIEVVGANETVVVAAGTFANCYKLACAQDSYLWYAKDVGLIKSEVDNITVISAESVVGTVNFVKELVSKNF